MKVAVTGGVGHIGKAVVQGLMERGDDVTVLDIREPESRKLSFSKVDVTDFVQVAHSLESCDAEAVVHLAAIAYPLHEVPHEVIRVNVTGTYNVLEACRQSGIKKVVVASSINAVGLSYNKVRPRIDYLPIDEAHPARPEDCYSLSKWLGEQIADAIVRLEPNMSIVSLRFHWVTIPKWYSHWRKYHGKDWGDFKGLWGYVDIRDAVNAVLKALSVTWTGHEVLFICASDTTSKVPTMELVKACYPDVPLKRELQGYEGLFDLRKAKELLDWKPLHSWRQNGYSDE
ncbi:MAG: NAD(P)-dependent oxidoreductase [Armatimonadota bacterium]|nr:NAD(P)-dependent oxidoreductase [Armatimonadota bacterium]MDW8026384.1 NAD(P)-dependent oxidoreductase [Armatimonadota bacterium]